MNEAIILAGGLGTRLRNIIGEFPKPMAEINGKPFLYYLINFLIKNEIKRIIFAVSYKKEIIIEYLKDKFQDIEIIFSIEKEPLGTGGAIKQALEFVQGDNVFVFNGDTYFDIELKEMLDFHKNKNSDITIGLKYLENIDRYGTVKVDNDLRIIKFEEKKLNNKGLINGGIYLINLYKMRNFFKDFKNKSFSFEKDILESYINYFLIYGIIFDSFFIDIGVKEDYERAQDEFKRFKY